MVKLVETKCSNNSWPRLVHSFFFSLSLVSIHGHVWSARTGGGSFGISQSGLKKLDRTSQSHLCSSWGLMRHIMWRGNLHQFHREGHRPRKRHLPQFISRKRQEVQSDSDMLKEGCDMKCDPDENFSSHL